MPGNRDLPGTTVGIRYCEGEGRLQRTLSTSPLTAFNVITAREMVSELGISVEDGMNIADPHDRLTENVQAQLRGCLGRIAAGECPTYSK